jgi:hypothetical protein
MDEYVVKATGYNVTSLNFGFASKLNATSWLDISSNLGLGFSSCKRKEVSGAIINNNDAFLFYTEQAKAVPLNANFKVDFDLKLSEKVRFSLGTIYQYQRAKFNIVSSYGFVDQPLTKETGTYKQWMNFNTVLFGLKFNL